MTIVVLAVSNRAEIARISPTVDGLQVEATNADPGMRAMVEDDMRHLVAQVAADRGITEAEALAVLAAGWSNTAIMTRTLS